MTSPEYALFNKHREHLGFGTAPITFLEPEDIVFGTEPLPYAVLVLPKSKQLIDMVFQFLATRVVARGKIIVIGANNTGIGSAKKVFERHIGPVREKIVGYHCALYVGHNTLFSTHTNINTSTDARKNIDDFLTYIPFTHTYNNQSITFDIAHIPGVFGGEKIDIGTRLLLDSIPYTPGNILDIGCGSGIIGSTYKAHQTNAQVTMTDNNPFALYATHKTIEKNDINAHTLTSDVFSGFDSRPEIFDVIISNPPFHSGIATDYSFIEKFTQQVHMYTKGGSIIYIVANVFLPYEKLLNERVGHTEIIAQKDGFKVLKTLVKNS